MYGIPECPPSSEEELHQATARLRPVLAGVGFLGVARRRPFFDVGAGESESSAEVSGVGLALLVEVLGTDLALALPFPFLGAGLSDSSSCESSLASNVMTVGLRRKDRFFFGWGRGDLKVRIVLFFRALSLLE